MNLRRRPHDPAALFADNARAKSVRGWRPVHDDLKEIGRQARAWEKKLATEQTGD